GMAIGLWGESHILHLSQEQAFRPVPQRVHFLVEQAGKPVHKQLIENGATSQVNRSQRAASIGFELNSGWAMFSVLVAQPTIHWCQRNVKRSTGLLFDD
ncbi:MAG TPA: hypothetical protein VLA84_12375, partial [Microcoleus sp.]|nr:hypothetical protein [Microcoleus sp.]